MTQSQLDICNVSCERDDRLLFQNLSFSCAHGSLTQIAGVNGAGKTSLLAILAGLLNPLEGDIRVDGNSIYDDMAAFHQRLLYFPHRPAIKLELTARQNLNFLIRLHGGGATQADLDSALQEMGLLGYEETLCRHLSAGQLRRVALARLIISEADVWLLDEPFTALDVQAVSDLEGLLSKKASAGKCILFTTHHTTQMKNYSKITLGGASDIDD
jgi:heme exporter protein A